MKNFAMKGMIGMAVATMLTMGMVNVSHAQARPLGAKRPHINAGNQGGSKRATSPTNQQIKPILSQLAQAEKLMKTALPIYHGHRAMAMDYNHISMAELRLAMKQNYMDGRLNSSFQAKLNAVKPKEETPTRRYTQDEINASNAKMQQALALITAAKGALASVPADSGGHIANANTSIDKTISEINLALQTVGNSGVIKP